MRGFSKAIALLSSAVASAFVVPETLSAGAGIEASEPVIEYHASKAALSFHHDSFRPLDTQETNLTLEIEEVQPSDRPCDYNDNILLLGHRLPSHGSGLVHTDDGEPPFFHGEQRFANYPSISAKWRLHCLMGSVQSDVNHGAVEVATKVFSVSLRENYKAIRAGFTVSYTQVGQPRILRFQPQAIGPIAVEKGEDYWRSSAPSIPHPEIHESKESDIEPPKDRRKTFSSSFHSFGQHILKAYTSVKHSAIKAAQACRHHVHALKVKIHEAIGKLCPDHEQERLSKLKTGLSSSTTKPIDLPPDRLVQVPTPAHTRSIHATSVSDFQADAFETLPTPTSPSIASTQQSPTGHSSPASPVHFLKLLFIALALFTLLTCIITRFRNPRRRAERAAEREESRNRRLYKRAAWSHWWQTRVCFFRHRHCPRSRGTGTSNTWDEKRALVLQQEGVLEAVCQDDIRRLRASTRPRRTGVSSIAAAEEGRNTFVYDSDGEASSTRRQRSVSGRSVTTLPGYESETTQPPGYATDDITPDSSIVSTSPRISRDGGLGSEDGLWAKDIEPLDPVPKPDGQHWQTRQGKFGSVNRDSIACEQPTLPVSYPFVRYSPFTFLTNQASSSRNLANNPGTSTR